MSTWQPDIFPNITKPYDRLLPGHASRKTEAPMTRRIASVTELVKRMRPGAILTKSYSRGGPTYEVRGQQCDPYVVREAISDGFLRPRDRGLFDDMDAQTFELVRSSK